MAHIPAVVKHLTIQIYRKTGLRALTKDKFRQAYQLAVSRCQQLGYITGGGVNFQLTQLGQQHAIKHEHEGMRGFVKDREFDIMFAWIIGQHEKVTDIRDQAKQKQDWESNDQLHTGGRNEKK